jgi:PAS domain S-box-containing protein
MTLTRRLLLLALISVLPAIAIWTYTEVSLRRAREAEVTETAIRQARIAGAELERILDGVQGLLLAVDETPSIRSFDTAACSPYLKAVQEKVPYVLSFVAIDLNGYVRCRPSGTVDTKRRFSVELYFQSALVTRGFVVGRFTRNFEEGELTNRPVLPLALPIRDHKGDMVGVVAAALDLRWLNEKMKERVVPADGSVMITDRDGVVLAHQPHPERFVGTVVPPSAMPHAMGDRIGAFETVSLDGVKRILGYLPFKMPPGDIYVSAGLSTRAAFYQINRAARRGFMLIAAALLLALSLSGLISRVFITRPFEIMTDTIRAWRQGNYQARIKLRGDSSELGVLARAFNDLMDDVNERQTALQASEEHVRLALDAGHMGTWWYDHAKAVGGWSSQASLLLGFPAAEKTVTLQEWRELIHPDDARRVADKLRDAALNDGHYEDEYRVRRPDGTICWISSRGRIFFDGKRKPISFVGVFQDITERKHAEDQQRFFLDELNHRVKNTLTTVQSIASQTLRSTSTPSQFKEAFEGRLLALSKTHDLLTRKSWREADLRDIAEQELAPYRKSDERVRIVGPSVHLPARYAINLGLVLHELVTNAAKYGALSTPAGQLELRWAVVPHQDRSSRLRIHWRESGGPTVEPPKRQGFGSQLIRRSIEGELAGDLAIRFAPNGVAYDISAPLH